MSTVDVVWRAKFADDAHFSLVPKCTTLLGPWAQSALYAESVAQACAEVYLDDGGKTWRDWFGNNDARGQLVIEILAPAPITGLYAVELERSVKARATKRAHA